MSATAGGRALQALLLGAVCIGLSGVFVKLSEVGPQASAFYRIGLSAPIFWLWLARTPARNGHRPLDRHEILMLALAGLVVFVLLCQVIGSGLIAYALAHLPATFSSLTLLLQPVFSALTAWVILGERLGVIELAGGSLVLIGVYLARRTS